MQSFSDTFPDNSDTAPPKAWLKSPSAIKIDPVDRIPMKELLFDAAILKIVPDALLLFPDAKTDEICACTFLSDRQNTCSKYTIPPILKQLGPLQATAKLLL
jgi:hypothetical protein